ncbi:MAG TPA: VWA-like domain-containing protein [Thermoanaerobaculia bacterium]|nr:VWA-like domain-containing protein [Thermoanaerobaculia bacterium]
MRHLVFAVALLVASAAHAAVTFVSPLDGSQAIGTQVLEVTTTAANVDRVEFFVDGVMAGVARKPPYRVAFDFGTSMTARTVSAKVWSNGFRSSETASVTTAAMTVNDTLDVDLVEVPLRVRSSRALKATDLRVRENGVEQTIRDVRLERPPAHFAFVVDRSLSMNDGKLDATLRAVQSELRQLRAGDTASLVLFNHHVAKARPIEQGETLTSDLAPSGGTSLRDALASVASKQRTYAIVLTDGGDRNSEMSEETALRKISGTHTIVNAIVLGNSHAKFLDRAASNTGGSVVSASRTNVREALARLLTDINSRYLVVYQSQGTKRGWRTVDVKPRGRGVTIVSARKGYFAE